MIRRAALLSLLALSAASAPAHAVVGGTPALAGDPQSRWTVRVEGSRGNLCTGVAIGRRLVLTAAHCVINGGAFRVVTSAPGHRPATIRVVNYVAHDSFLPGRTPSTQPGIDLAVLALARDLPASIQPTGLGGSISAGEAITVSGFGLGEEGREATARRLRQARLVATGAYTAANSVVVAVDPDRRGASAGAGACNGDSGGPILRAGTGEVIGLVSWSSAPAASSFRRRQVCGGFTAITPVAQHRAWIDSAAQALSGAAAPAAWATDLRGGGGS